MLAMPQMRAASTVNDPEHPTKRKVVYEAAASPRELLESCVIQAQAGLRGLSATSAINIALEPLSEEAKRMTKEELEAKAKQVEKPSNSENIQLESFW